jgi:hypothetical protein
MSIPIVNICMLRLEIIFKYSNVYCVILKAHSIMAFNSTTHLLVSCLLILILIGLAILIHVNLPPTILYSWAPILSLGAPRNNPLFLALVLKLKYRSLVVANVEVAWIVHLLRDLRLQLSSPPKILCDNKSVIFMVANLVTQPRSKHIAIDYHFVHELIVNGSLKVAFVSSHLQLVDFFTK